MQPTRFACDRCRGQKLRCLRERGNCQPCKRCHKAGVACLDSPQARIGRARRSSTTDTFGYERQEPEIRSPLSTGFHLHNENLFPILAEDTFATGEDLIPHPAELQFGNISDIQPTVTSFEYPSQWSPFDFLPSNDVQSSNFTPLETSRIFATTSTKDQTLERTLPMASSPSHISDCAPSYITTGRNRDPGIRGDNQDPGTSRDHLRQENLKTVAARNTGHGSNQLPATAQGYFTGETETKRLLELSQSLYIQHKALEAAPWTGYLSTLSLTAGIKHSTLLSEKTGVTEPVGDILFSSEKFLEIITHFMPSTQNYDDVEVMESIESQSSELNQTDIASFQHTTPSPRTLNLPSPNPKGPPPPDQLDTATILLVLNCYIRLLFIYTTLFSHINQYLYSSNSPKSPSNAGKSFFSHNNPEPLHIGGFSLHSYGEIQIKILVDISVHFITNIEQILGVPQKYRLLDSDTTDDKEIGDGSSAHGSLLMTPQMKMLLEMVIKMAELDIQDGSGIGELGASALRKEFDALRKLHTWKI
ncbi:hypothetical protein G7Y89_g6483 [Cudoniella acicularis]|uniref:Zn(2)-C6 fungal-type domain-containing protein n=1 Tax=Cudoniella acicularis TaxID=354080 RepID=A0A8H4RMM0_9HELO|nr:hypothetical protein G7Y89_g6483 [Cudoniella acicularis]